MFDIKHYPRIKLGVNFIPKSPICDEYNCIAWSLDIDYMSVGHENLTGIYWPDNISKIPNINNYKRMYNSYGFIDASTSDLEEGFKKVAIYVRGTNPKTGIVVHAAKQIDDIWWSSKMGDNIDGIHHLDAIQGILYGYPRFFMKKPI